MQQIIIIESDDKIIRSKINTEFITLENMGLIGQVVAELELMKGKLTHIKKMRYTRKNIKNLVCR